MKTEAPSFTIGDIQLFERPVTLRLPFRFGVVTLTHAPQAYARLRITLPDGRSAWGSAAELMAPKWFDKNPALSNEQNFDQLRRSLLNAVNAYAADPTPRTAFGHSAAHHAAYRGVGRYGRLRQQWPASGVCLAPGDNRMGTLAGCKVRVVDDDRFIRNTIKLVLRAIDRFVIDEADDGDVALVRTDAFTPDVVLCDITMPRMGGLQYVAQLRRHPTARMRGTPVVILTGQAEESMVLDAIKLQISGFLVKPVSPKALGGCLQKIVGQRHAVPSA